MDEFNKDNENIYDQPKETVSEISETKPADVFYGNYNYNDNINDVNVGGKKSNIPLILLLILILIMVSALTIYCIFTDMQMGSLEFNKKNNTDGGFSININSRPENGEKNYTDENGRYTTEGLAEHIRPQVVEIITYSDKFPNKAISSGSGIIISEDGYIVTNTHIIDVDLFEVDTLKVATYDGNEYYAEVTGHDVKTDVAVIKINASGLPCAEFGNSDEAVVGERVAAIGNPEGLSGSITDGIISGLNRKIKTDTTSYEMDCIQTNAAVSPGNSGGALVNMYGQVIGITSSKYSDAYSEGLGFAITINEAKPIIEELISQGYISGRIRVGIVFYSMDNAASLEEFKKKYKKDIPEKLKGLWITDVSPDCDISNTELKTGDFILSVNDERVMNYDDLNMVIDGKKAGDVLKAKCARIDDDMNISYFEIEFELMADTSGNY